jgi:DsbC/DsbD-like thiol-disulfide interchange protein
MPIIGFAGSSTGRPTLAAVAIALLSASPTVRAQVPNLVAELSPIVESDGVAAGTAMRVALDVRLDPKLHANSNRPRDPLLIPMVLTVQSPPGISVAEIVYPEPKDLKQVGAEQPLSVFEREFTIGVRLDVARDAPVTDVAVPAQLSYQACDETTCYKPVTVKTAWTFRVVPAGTTVRVLEADKMKAVAFGSGEAHRNASVGFSPPHRER